MTFRTSKSYKNKKSKNYITENLRQGKLKNIKIISPKAFSSPKSEASPEFDPADVIVVVVMALVATAESNPLDLVLMVVSAVVAVTVAETVDGSSAVEYPGTAD